MDREKIFAASGDTLIRYKDLAHHLEEETADGKLLLFAISRAPLMKRSREQEMQALLQIIAPSERKEPSSL